MRLSSQFSPVHARCPAVTEALSLTQNQKQLAQHGSDCRVVSSLHPDTMDMTPHFPIYMDYGATTPCDGRVVDAMIPWLREHFGNPASRSHPWGWEAEEAVEKARVQVAELISADPREIVWTSGATESNNLAIKGAAQFYKTRGKHIVTVKTEHKAVLDTVREMERVGFDATYLDVQEDGLLDLNAFKAALRPDTIVVSVMFVNNETGVIQDIAAIGAICRERGIIFHVDAAQATGKVEIDLATLPVDLMSLASHKTYGPKGIGALYVRRKPRVRLEAQMHGGGHERGMRSGTLPVHQIVGMGEAFRIARVEMGAEIERVRALQQRLLKGLADIEQVYINGHLEKRVAHNVNASFNYVEGESLIMGIKGLAVSSGSACTSASLEPSYVLRALGRSDELAHSSLRMTIGRFTTEEEIDYAITTLKDRVAKLRELSPLWEMYKDGVDISTIQWSAH
jgi:cysteine desulfurase